MRLTQQAGPGTPARTSLPRPGSPRKATGLITLLVLLMIGGGTLVGVLVKPSDGPGTVTPQQLAAAGNKPPPPGIASRTLPATDAQAMGLHPVRPVHAPDFTLTDQHGRRFALDQLDRAHAVVLSFVDDRCTGVCPVISREIADAYHDLGTRAPGVEFVSVNVNATHNATSWLRAFIARKSPELGSVPTFRYLTGSIAALRTVWADYGITVDIDPDTGALYNSEGMYFIAPGGREIYQATPYANVRRSGIGWLPQATITQWGRGIAKYAEAAALAGKR